MSPNDSLLGKEVQYPKFYDPSLLFPIPRAENRNQLGIFKDLPFHGVDIWNAYELSWLESATNKPRIAMAEFSIPCESTNIIESKSLKLYLDSLNFRCFKNETELKEILQKDLSEAADAPVRIHMLLPPFNYASYTFSDFTGYYLDDLPVTVDTFEVNPEFLVTEPEIAEESLYSNLLKSNCPVTRQPDWASVCVRYKGPQINRTGLLKYIISFREHTEFNEQCVERMFLDIFHHCRPEKLTIYARYTRRGGLDINAFRSNFERKPLNIRNLRQ